MIGFAVIFSLPRISFFMALVALINVVFTAIALVTAIAMVTAIPTTVAMVTAISTAVTAAIPVTGISEDRRSHH
ncbi:Uncharacterised protein [Klebsiella pneumoniae]|nr:Uncharacterised protein [Klebsiella pneumoniae]